MYSGNVISLNKTTFVAFTYNGNILNIYINGNLDSSSSITGTVPTSASWVAIGANLAGGGTLYGSPYNRRFQGYIYNVQLYNSTLDANSIKALYVEGVGGAPINLQNLMGWWPLNGNANDYSGNLNNGATTNVIYVSQK